MSVVPTYSEVLNKVNDTTDNLQTALFLFELGILAKHVRIKTGDSRPIHKIMELIVDEYLDGSWDYREYLCNKQLHS